MRLKVLIVPFFIVMVLILAIGYIKPDFDTIQMKKADIVLKDAAVANTEAVLANVGTLNSALDTQMDSETFVYRYLPETLAQDQAIDAFNFLASQSGLVITDMELKKSPEEVVVNADGTTVVDPNALKTFVLTGSVMGSYENIRTFFDQVSHIERFQTIRSFSITTDPNVVPVDTTRLIGTFETEFAYLPSSPVTSALSVPAFLQAKFDFSDIDTLLGKITSPVPLLEKGQTGKPNPFQ
ncbi:MAG: hypothetical protein A3E38_01040 [Candidatus Moranbacteria bacterium RIFCSPHIGHO2_12_FULL_54_9]|nr:MAG: hypothetical protein A2878_02340 [Candidatus Moranbacteria bacterium RIFCSPHIGHO2_01_FULL_54_31]OGI25016.1 MAG: hypothetical protein A3E38_01040 [Candidatus Moranbacteria bacterium RIFCSPHIGHO2_12_FULL_54_9]